MSLFKDVNPDLLKEYDFEKNASLGLDLETISPSSDKRAYWRCQVCGGVWEASFAERNRHRGCPYCSGKKVLPGYNDLVTRFPEVAAEWDYEKNYPLTPSDVMPFSNKDAYWVCNNGHSYISKISRRTSQGQGCPYCAGKKAFPGFNDLESKYPEIAKEWDYDKNAPLLPSEVTYGSKRTVWWKCPVCGYEWKASINTRTSGEGCKVCGNKRGAKKRIQKLIESGSSITDKVPHLLKEWDYEKNQVSPNEVACTSHQKYWWICERGHSYNMSAADKFRGYGCPYCSGKRVLKGFNDLESHNPELLAEWDYEKNTIKPSEITYGSNRTVWWKCQNCGRSYQLSVQEKRYKKNKYCTICKKQIGSSIPEQTVYYYVQKVFTDAINGYRDNALLGKKALDIYIPSIKVAIEYDGRAWHDNQSRDIQKAEILASEGISLIRLRETGAPEINDNAHIILVQRNKNEDDYLFLQKPIEELLQLLCKDHGVSVPKVDIENDISGITSGFLRLQKDNSLAECYPEVAKELHPTKNKGLDPRKIGCRSGQMVWWKCPTCGREWRSRIIERTTKGQGCKVCRNKIGAEKRIANKLATQGSFVDQYPELLKEWDFDKNADISPYDYTVFSHKSVWWKCKTCGHEWQARIAARTKVGQGCPQCYREGIVENQIMLDIEPGRS